MNVSDLKQQAGMRVKTPQEKLTVREQLLWVNDNLGCKPHLVVAPNTACKEMLTFYSDPKNRDKFYSKLVNKVLGPETEEEKKSTRSTRRKSASPLVKDINEMIKKASTSA